MIHSRQILFFILFWQVLVFQVNAQDLQGLIGDSPFANQLETEKLISGLIQEGSINLSHQFNRFDNSRLGASYRFNEVTNEIKNVPDFRSHQFGLSYKHYLGEERFAGVFGSYGSAGDKPFKDARDNTVSVNGLYRHDSKWLWLANYSNNRAFLNNVPLPGVLYIVESGRDKNLILGFPFVNVLQPFWKERFSIRYTGLLPYNHKLRLLYNHLGIFKPYLALEQGPRFFFDSERRSDALRTFWFERKMALGLEKSFGPFLKIDLQFGKSFDREFFQARSFGNQHKNTIHVRAGEYLALNLRSSF